MALTITTSLLADTAHPFDDFSEDEIRYHISNPLVIEALGYDAYSNPLTREKLICLAFRARKFLTNNPDHNRRCMHAEAMKCFRNSRRRDLLTTPERLGRAAAMLCVLALFDEALAEAAYRANMAEELINCNGATLPDWTDYIEILPGLVQNDNGIGRLELEGVSLIVESEDEAHIEPRDTDADLAALFSTVYDFSLEFSDEELCAIY